MTYFSLLIFCGATVFAEMGFQQGEIIPFDSSFGGNWADQFSIKFCCVFDATKKSDGDFHSPSDRLLTQFQYIRFLVQIR